MDQLEAKFSRLGVDNAPGQEVTQAEEELQLVGEKIPGNRSIFLMGTSMRLNRPLSH